MPTNRTPRRRRVRGKLSIMQEQALCLGVPRDAFVDEEECREAWERHEPRLMELYGRGGRRPKAWWWYDSELSYPGADIERSTLFEADLLARDERAELLAWWRGEFERAQAPGFTYCVGQRDGGGALWLDGGEARAAHYAWADIPRSLIRRWARGRAA